MRLRACMGVMLVTLIILSPYTFASPIIYPFSIQWDGSMLLWQYVDGVVRWKLQYELPETGERGLIAQLDGSVTTTELGLKFAGGRYVYVTINGYDADGSVIATDKVGFYLSRHVDLTASTLDRLRWMLSDVVQSVISIVTDTSQQLQIYIGQVTNNFQQFITSTFIPSRSPAFDELQDSAQRVLDKTPVGQITRDAQQIRAEIDEMWEGWINGLPSDAVEFQKLFTFDYGNVYGMDLKIEFPIAMFVQQPQMQRFWDICEAIILITFVLMIIRRLGVQISV